MRGKLFRRSEDPRGEYLNTRQLTSFDSSDVLNLDHEISNSETPSLSKLEVRSQPNLHPRGPQRERPACDSQKSGYERKARGWFDGGFNVGRPLDAPVFRNRSRVHSETRRTGFGENCAQILIHAWESAPGNDKREESWWHEG
jgi:hypothetical protein